ncbi:MAG: DNA repair protein RecO [Chloroflexota bacterium]|jgi:DNA repair protein RecO (recombination protein O)
MTNFGYTLTMPRERTYRTEAVVIRRSDFGEADRLLTLFSADRGKLRAIAKGARKPQSRKTGHVELFMRSKFLVATGRDLDIITQAEMLAAYPHLRDDLVRTTYAAYTVELLDRFTVDDDPHRDIYGLLVQTLEALNGEPDMMLLAARYFELRLLSLTGFQPRLFNCVSCGEAIREEDQFFSADLGGFLCPSCFEVDSRALPVSAVSVKVMRYLQTRPWETVQQLHLRPAVLHEIERILHDYLVHILERDLKSVDFLHRLRREARE